MPNYLLKHSRVYSAADSVCYVCVTAAVHGQIRSSNFLHQIPEFTLSKVVKILVTTKSFNQFVACTFYCFLS